MPNTPVQNSDSFLLGEIKATVTGTADDVKAIRLDMGELSRRVGNMETRVEAIEAEREILVPQYTRWKHDISNEVQKLMAEQHKANGAWMGGNYIGKLMIGVASMLVGAGVVVGVQKVEAPREVTKTEMSVQHTSPAPPPSKPAS